MREAINENIVETAPVDETKQEEPSEAPKLPRLTIHQNEPIIDRKSIFQAFYVDINTAAQAEQFRQQLLENNKIQAATHNMFVWKVNDGGIIKSDCDEDGESGAGSRMMHLVDLTGACDFGCIVTRWYGGVHLGPDRWKHINNSLRSILDEHGQIKRKK